MRQVRYCVAVSLDGYIAGPNGEADWIVMDPDIDFAAMFSRYDTLLIGRKSFEAMQAMMSGAEATADMGMGANIKSIIFSRTLRQEDHPDVTIVGDAESLVQKLKSETGKDIWLWGGGELFSSLLTVGLVDGVDVAVMPVILGDGIPFAPTPAPRTSLLLKTTHHFEKTGIVSLEYDVLSE